MAKHANTSLGLDENLEAALAYLGIWITGLVFLIVEKKSKFVRFHALQSIVAFGGLMVLSWALGIVPILGWILGYLLMIASFILWIFCMYQAYKGKMFEIPIIGPFVKKQKI
jgi:uncharacterized membrane protein